MLCHRGCVERDLPSVMECHVHANAIMRGAFGTVNRRGTTTKAIACFNVVVPFPSGALAREEHGRFG